jgi:tetratricopeptide (TPR) repeat protein
MSPNPTDADALFAEGNALLAKGCWSDAIARFEQSLQLRPQHAQTHANLGAAQGKCGNHPAALAAYDAALRLNPTLPEAHANRGNALTALHRDAEALAACEEAIRLKPDLAQAWLGRAHALSRLGRHADAVLSCWRAVEVRPEYPDARTNLGHFLLLMGRLEEAIEQFETALDLRPGCPDAHTARAQAWLLRGDFRRGWPEYEARLRRQTIPERPIPQWNGEPLDGRSILLRAEQGFGDSLQFVRYAALVKQAGARRVVAEFPPRLHQLLSTCSGIDEFAVRDRDVGNCDYQIPLLSLPNIFRTSLRTIPGKTPYLFAEPKRVKRWKSHLPDARLRIGITWQGNTDNQIDHVRSIPLAAFERLAKLPGVRLVSLQRWHGLDQIAQFQERSPLHELGPEVDQDAAFVDTAAVMMSLDLVVSTDSAIAHLAGALNRPVYIALTYSSDWRWFRDRDDSPWYPTARLFRQERLGDWTRAIEEMTELIVSTKWK